MIAYFGGGGVQGVLHPSLKLYVECFDSPPFPKVYPRGGGVLDQDPILMRDFRLIRKYEVSWKQNQEHRSAAQNDAEPGMAEGAPSSLEGMLDKYLEEQGLSDESYF